MRAIGTATAVVLVLMLVAAGCSTGGGSGAAAASRRYDEGLVRIEIDRLDTGLLKGYAYAEPAEGFSVESIHVRAEDPRGRSWPVIEIPEEGRLFFEVTVQELARGEQLTITATVAFSGASGAAVERTVSDRWPP
jgi:hypothetical protein